MNAFFFLALDFLPSLVLLIVKFIGCCGNSDVECGWSSQKSSWKQRTLDAGTERLISRLFGVRSPESVGRIATATVALSVMQHLLRVAFLESKLPHLE